jgi:predicted small lipoprotein YifL
VAPVEPLIPAKAEIQNWVPVSAGTSGIGRALLFVAGFAAAVALAGCGREGPLEQPPGPASSAPAVTSQLRSPDGTPAPGSPQDTAAKTGFDAQGNPVATPSRNRPFILDPLLQ